MSASSPGWVEALLAREQLPASYRTTIEATLRPLAARIAARARAISGVLPVGLCGAQGSGKTTAATALGELLRECGTPAAVLSLDDFYLTHAARQALARSVHPLLITRGVPGTHDLPLALEIIAALQRGERPALPRFDKSRDDRLPAARWQRPPAAVKVVLLEGWCTDARPEPETALQQPINDLERNEDAGGIWRRYVNAQLAGPYRALFDPLAMLILLQAPSFEVVYRWRLEQEHKLRARLAAAGQDSRGVMDDAAVARFIAHYERVTRHILAEMPRRANQVIRLDATRAVIGRT
ncbi:MAG: hypothetical protein QM696_06190 [Steroidobacteraceae bacterium]